MVIVGRVMGRVDRASMEIADRVMVRVDMGTVVVILDMETVVVILVMATVVQGIVDMVNLVGMIREDMVDLDLDQEIDEILVKVDTKK